MANDERLGVGDADRGDLVVAGVGAAFVDGPPGVLAVLSALGLLGLGQLPEAVHLIALFRLGVAVLVALNISAAGQSDDWAAIALTAMYRLLAFVMAELERRYAYRGGKLWLAPATAWRLHPLGIRMPRHYADWCARW